MGLPWCTDEAAMSSSLPIFPLRQPKPPFILGPLPYLTQSVVLSHFISPSNGSCSYQVLPLTLLFLSTSSLTATPSSSIDLVSFSHESTAGAASDLLTWALHSISTHTTASSRNSSIQFFLSSIHKEGKQPWKHSTSNQSNDNLLSHSHSAFAVLVEAPFAYRTLFRCHT